MVYLSADMQSPIRVVTGSDVDESNLCEGKACHVVRCCTILGSPLLAFPFPVYNTFPLIAGFTTAVHFTEYIHDIFAMVKKVKVNL